MKIEEQLKKIEERAKKLEEERKRLLEKQQELRSKYEKKMINNFVAYVGKENLFEFVNYCNHKKIEKEVVSKFFKKFTKWFKQKIEEQSKIKQSSEGGGYSY